MIDYFKRPEISKSDLTLFKESTRKFYERKFGDEAKKITPYMQLGTQFHIYLLENEKFNDIYTVLDCDVPISKQQINFALQIVNGTDTSIAYSSNYSIKNKTEVAIKAAGNKLEDELQDYIKFLVKSSGKIAISEDDFKKVKIMSESVMTHKLARKLVEDATYKEKEIYWQNDVTYVFSNKSKIDIIQKIDTDEFLHSDIKTCASMDTFGRNFYKLDYGEQFSYYDSAIRYEQKDILNLIDIKHKVIVQESNYPYECKVIPLNDVTIRAGREKNEILMKELAWHYKENLWDYRRIYYEGNGEEYLNNL